MTTESRERPATGSTMKDVARLAGCDPSTVSLALRNDPRITEATRKRVLAAAQRLNYRVNPLVAAWVSARRAGKPATRPVPVAYLTSHHEGFNWREDAHFRSIHDGVQSGLNQQGFRLEAVDLNSIGRNFSRLRNIFETRATQGIILGPTRHDFRMEDIGWENYSCVRIGYSCDQPAFHRVTEDHYIGMCKAHTACTERGFRRIGLALLGPHNTQRFSRWMAAYLHSEYSRAEEVRIPPLVRSRNTNELPFLNQWLDKWKPDVVLVDSPEPWQGKDLETVCISPSEATGEGILENNREIGRVAADLIVLMLHRNERGIPACPRTVMVEPTWLGGDNLNFSASCTDQPHPAGHHRQS